MTRCNVVRRDHASHTLHVDGGEYSHEPPRVQKLDLGTVSANLAQYPSYELCSQLLTQARSGWAGTASLARNASSVCSASLTAEMTSCSWTSPRRICNR